MNSALCSIASRLLLGAGFLVVGCLGVRADILELKNGTLLKGQYEGGSAGTVRFTTSAGIQVLATNELVALTFTGGGTSSAPSSAPAAPPAAPQPRTITLAAGAVLTVRMMDTVSSKNSAGDMFTARLEGNVTANGTVVIPAGTMVYGKVNEAVQERRGFGRSSLDIRLTSISVDGTSFPMMTDNFKEVSQSSGAGQAARGALAGAAIGGLADGNDGAQKGAAIGAAAGILKRGDVITIPPNTLLQFTLTTPLTVTVK
ncbi:MAG TPA: hypothetical protein VFJ90_16340 [Candidatus Didemnitutus sp.]|nr:hypothetical protein [Candidatus Didemnitutus sp.]